MSLRHIVPFFIAFCALCSSLTAQGLTHEWTVPYPYKSMPSISSDGSLFASTLDTTSIVRYNGATGSIRDTVTTPLVESPDRVAFCGNTLYVLSGSRNDSLVMYRCAASSTQCDSTPYTFRFTKFGDGDLSRNVYKVGLYAVSHYPHVMLASSIDGSHWGYSTMYYFGKCEDIDTTTFTPVSLVEGRPMAVSWSADLRAFTRTYYMRMYDPQGSPDYDGSGYWCNETYNGEIASYRKYYRDNSDGESTPRGFAEAVHSGALHNIIYDTVVYDMSERRQITLPDKKGRILASIYPPLYVLKISKGAGGDVLSAYHYLNGTSHDLDTVPSCTDVWINGVDAIMYLLDTVSKTLTRYRIAPYQIADSISISVDKDRQKIRMPVGATVQLFSAKNAAHRLEWSLGDTTFSVNERTTKLVSANEGIQIPSVVAIDTVSHDTLRATGSGVTFYRPGKNIMVSDDTTDKRVVYGCSRSGTRLMIGGKTTLHDYQIPTVPADASYAPRLIGDWSAFGTYYSGDSMRLVLAEPRGGFTYFRYYHTDPEMTDPVLVDTLTVDNVKPYVTSEIAAQFRNKAVFNTEQRQHITHFRVGQTPGYRGYVYDGIWLHASRNVPKGRWLMRGQSDPYIYQPTPEIFYADASYRSTLLLTEGVWLRSVDLTTMDTLFKIDRAFVGYPTESIQLDPTTIITNNGILKRSSYWERKLPFNFSDGIKVFRMDDQHSLVLRKNVSNIASVIDHATGAVIEDIGEGFGAPIDGVYDRTRNLLHVVDTNNFVSSYAIDTPVSVENEEVANAEHQLQIRQRSSGRYEIMLPEGTTGLNVYDLTGRCVCTVAVNEHASAFEFEMPSTLRSGLYLVVARGDRYMSTATMVHWR